MLCFSILVYILSVKCAYKYTKTDTSILIYRGITYKW